MSRLRDKVIAHPAARRVWRHLPPGAQARLRPVLGLPEPLPTPPPPDEATSQPREAVETLEAMRARIQALREAPPAEARALYDALCRLMLDPPPEVAEMRALDPFSPDYAARAMALLATLRGRPGYDPHQDERLGHGMQDRDLWSGLSPWDFRDPALVAEFLDAHAAMLRALPLPPPATVLEYGAGTGQFLLSLARMGYRCHAVDVEPEYLRLIERQAGAMGLSVLCEQGLFGEGFGDQRFDAILFFEAFHHAADFMPLLRRLRARLNPGGRLILCGEPIVPDGMTAGPVPYPWGPRLDGISIEAIERGWMELGFQKEFLLEALRRAGWEPVFVQHPATFRAHLIHATPREDFADAPA
ncbi:class I SAM-dependent methyltransferase [Sabulicella glaciei]|uniref:Class I SAM-dependent methyltransferase n=1 Tax=Sabulicella glaciei TaxID=2984948 RepID=A0ABT3NUE4_9PROT|nr:class I SAM-dependent methyltransferase [Roseococcus sp. MDT2-1-1]MCW8085179.1 class I SAM-dependent methyltransferase [Roseococcus sp. MDT2-1-1]